MIQLAVVPASAAGTSGHPRGPPSPGWGAPARSSDVQQQQDEPKEFISAILIGTKLKPSRAWCDEQQLRMRTNPGRQNARRPEPWVPASFAARQNVPAEEPQSHGAPCSGCLQRSCAGKHRP